MTAHAALGGGRAIEVCACCVLLVCSVILSENEKVIPINVTVTQYVLITVLLQRDPAP